MAKNLFKRRSKMSKKRTNLSKRRNKVRSRNKLSKRRNKVRSRNNLSKRRNKVSKRIYGGVLTPDQKNARTARLKEKTKEILRQFVYDILRKDVIKHRNLRGDTIDNINNLFIWFDEDDDRSINFHEFSTGLNQHGIFMNPQQKKDLFDYIDEDASGSINIEELAEFLHLTIDPDTGKQVVETAPLWYLTNDDDGNEIMELQGEAAIDDGRFSNPLHLKAVRWAEENQFNISVFPGIDTDKLLSERGTIFITKEASPHETDTLSDTRHEEHMNYGDQSFWGPMESLSRGISGVGVSVSGDLAEPPHIRVYTEPS